MRWRASIAPASKRCASPGPAASKSAQPHYYRIHGPTVLIEYDNTQNDANHIHTVYRDLERDFGGDALRAHYRRDAHRSSNLSNR